MKFKEKLKPTYNKFRNQAAEIMQMEDATNRVEKLFELGASVRGTVFNGPYNKGMFGLSLFVASMILLVVPVPAVFAVGCVTGITGITFAVIGLKQTNDVNKEKEAVISKINSHIDNDVASGKVKMTPLLATYALKSFNSIGSQTKTDNANKGAAKNLTVKS